MRTNTWIVLLAFGLLPSICGCNWFLEDGLGEPGNACFGDYSCIEGYACSPEFICVEDASQLDGDDTDGDEPDGDTDGDSDEVASYASPRWVRVVLEETQIGCRSEDEQCVAAEFPRHMVGFTPFEIMTTEVTVAMAATVLDDLPPLTNENGPCPACPFTDISWDEARQLCEALGGRLPSEAEWEAAARAGLSEIYVCGDDESCLPDVAWYADNSLDILHPVAQLEANLFGLYDVSGNAAEWVADTYQPDYRDAPETSAPWVVDAAAERVIRGGSFASQPGVLRVSYRSGIDAADSFGSLGVRCARDVKSE